MKSIEEIDKIIDMYLQGYDLSLIASESKTSEQTIKKYIRDFEETIEKLLEDMDSKKRYRILKKLTEGPSYNSKNRKSRVYDQEDLDMVKDLLENSQGKPVTKLYEKAKEKGLNVSYSTFTRMIKRCTTVQGENNA